MELFLTKPHQPSNQCCGALGCLDAVAPVAITRIHSGVLMCVDGGADGCLMSKDALMFVFPSGSPFQLCCHCQSCWNSGLSYTLLLPGEISAPEPDLFLSSGLALLVMVLYFCLVLLETILSFISFTPVYCNMYIIFIIPLSGVTKLSQGVFFTPL